MEIWKQFFAHDYYELCRKTRDDLKARAARSTESSDYELIRESMMSSDYETESTESSESMMSSDYETEIMITSDFEEEEEESEISSEVSGWDEEWGFRSGGSIGSFDDKSVDYNWDEECGFRSGGSIGSFDDEGRESEFGEIKVGSWAEGWESELGELWESGSEFSFLISEESGEKETDVCVMSYTYTWYTNAIYIIHC